MGACMLIVLTMGKTESIAETLESTAKFYKLLTQQYILGCLYRKLLLFVPPSQTSAIIFLHLYNTIVLPLTFWVSPSVGFSKPISVGFPERLY